jgi:hypothetical protein
MDNVQKHNNCINIPLSQTFRYYRYISLLGKSLFANLSTGDKAQRLYKTACEYKMIRFKI